jgi:hypothetical protein
VAVAAVVVCAAAFGIVWAVIRGGGPEEPDDTGTTPVDSVWEEAVPTPVDLVGRWAPDGAVVFTWTNPEPQPGDRYSWNLIVQEVDGPASQITSETSVTISGDDVDAVPCIEVTLVRASGKFSPVSAKGCAS